MVLYLLLTAIFFYITALLQVSFFSHFPILGTTPSLLFIIFVILVFFDGVKKNTYYNIIVWSAIAGTFLDIFSYSYFGISILLFLCIGLLIKRFQLSLKEQENQYPLPHFLMIFVCSFFIYQLATLLLKDPNILFALSPYILIQFLVDILYNTLIAIGGFIVLKKLILPWNDRKKLQSQKIL